MTDETLGAGVAGTAQSAAPVAPAQTPAEQKPAPEAPQADPAAVYEVPESDTVEEDHPSRLPVALRPCPAGPER